MLKSPDRNDLDPYIRQYDVAIDLSSKLHRSKLISILFKIRDVVYVQITISLASRLMYRSRSLTAVTSHRLVDPRAAELAAGRRISRRPPAGKKCGLAAGKIAASRQPGRKKMRLSRRKNCG